MNTKRIFSDVCQSVQSEADEKLPVDSRKWHERNLVVHRRADNLFYKLCFFATVKYLHKRNIEIEAGYNPIK